MAANIADGESGASARAKINSRFGNSTFVDYPNGITYNGGSDILLRYEEVTINLSTDGNAGDFTSGIINIVVVGRLVTITAEDVIAHPSNSEPASLTGLITVVPDAGGSVRNTYVNSSTRVATVIVFPDGQLAFEYRDYSGSLFAATTVGARFSISYVTT